MTPRSSWSLCFFLVVAAICYSLAFQAAGTSALRILANFILVHFVAAGALISTCAWWLADKYLRVKSVHGMEQPIEWMYAFDIHCNSFFPLFLILYVVHYLLLPFLIQATLPAAIVSNLLYAAALCYYTYITSLGYSTLPFLERTEVFLYPMALVLVSAIVLCTMRINLTHLSLYVLGV
eukprot:gnl/TRDRNA2_/TRDRNA2_169939_c0_seq4.p1 gnl/TRDRNA2_/TRDRNA2_169939_c0~~gnl/TRDRNA2_/TRDRNA2_169939_c0_seq4.p1  ORF type:complete len:179 (-),score=16.06 gnl/TRDRNA2_/TRDRNA2_169939_c0_seq4:135-671(-)